eukprot:scaffold2939_cov123-Cylindrotheca_fusiformis.AAC.11
MKESTTPLDDEQTSGLELSHFLPTAEVTARVDPIEQPAHDYPIMELRPSHHRWRWAIILSLMIAVTACAVALILTTPSSTKKDAAAPPSVSYYDSLERLLTQEDDPTWKDPMSPQYLALEWMAFRDNDHFLAAVTSTEDEDELLSQVQQRFALIAMFYASGLQWYKDWLQPGVSECEFAGIRCNSQQQVTFIDLKQGAMNGFLPHELGWLTHLTKLDLHDNRLRSKLPSSLLQLPHLIELDLSLNYFDGAVPNLPPNIQVLNLERNHFQGILPVWPLSLQMAKLGYNHWEASLPQFPQGNNLIFLEVVDSPKMTGTLPSSIGYLTKLKSLSLYQTQFSGSLPSEIGLLTDLEELSIGMTHMNGTLPEELWQATNLQWLVAVQHQFHGSISTRIGNLQQLQALNLLNGLLTGNIPTTLGSLPNLTWLQLAMNQMTGSIPVELSQASNLREYYCCCCCHHSLILMVVALLKRFGCRETSSREQSRRNFASCHPLVSISGWIVVQVMSSVPVAPNACRQAFQCTDWYPAYCITKANVVVAVSGAAQR